MTERIWITTLRAERGVLAKEIGNPSLAHIPRGAGESAIFKHYITSKPRFSIMLMLIVCFIVHLGVA
jgi:hypothetical protein